MDYEKMRAYRNSNNPHAQRLGIWLEELSEGHAVVTKTIGPEDLNPLEAVHGGVVFSMADVATGCAAASFGYMAVTVNAAYNYYRTAKLGDRLTGVATEVKHGRTICVFEARITDQNDKLVGSGTFTYFLHQDKEIILK